MVEWCGVNQAQSRMSTHSEQEVIHLSKADLKKIGDFWLIGHYSGNDDAVSRIRDCHVGNNDVLIATFPKSGTAWLERIVSLIKLNCDVTLADSKRLDELSIMIEKEGVDAVLQQREPRIIKTHFDFSKIPRSFREGQGKIIYLARNPKDVMVSYYHFARSAAHVMLDMPFEDFFERFLEGTVVYGPWVLHMKDFWSHRKDKNFLFVQYEDLQKNLKEKIREIAAFLGTDLSDEEVEVVARESSFTRMKRNPSTNYDWYSETGITDKTDVYMRKGVVGDWKNTLTESMSQRIDELVDKELTPLGLTFNYE